MRFKMLTSFGAALLAGFVFSLPAAAQSGPSDPLDTDGDGVTDDQCLGSDLSATVVIGTCDSEVANPVFTTGCSIADLVGACAVGPSNHGRYVSCVSRTTNALKKAHVITGREKGAIQRCAAQSAIGKPAKP